MPISWEISAGLDGLRPQPRAVIPGVAVEQTAEARPSPMDLAKSKILDDQYTEFFGTNFQELEDPSAIIDQFQLTDPIFATLVELQSRELIPKAITADQIEGIIEAVMEGFGPEQQLVVRPDDIAAQVERTFRACSRLLITKES